MTIYSQSIGLMSRVFANSSGGWGSIPGRVIPKSQKMLLEVALLNTQHYKVMIKGKVEQFRKWSIALPYTLVYYSFLTKVASVTYIYILYVFYELFF